MPSHFLSKSQYLRGLQCHKSLWLYKDGKIKPKTPSPSLKVIFDEGTRVGEIAQDLFPAGKIIQYEGSTFDEKIAETAEYIVSGETTIYEATFKFDGILVMVDILKKGTDGWEIYEVKSTSDVRNKYKAAEIKNVFLNDTAIQYYVLKGSGLDVSKASLVHLNNKYVRSGALEIDKLFSIVDLTESVVGMQSEVCEELEKIRKALSNGEPKIGIGVHCDKPYECDFKIHCWNNIPDYSVFNIAGLYPSKKFELYSSGIIKVKDVPVDFSLSDDQKLQVEVEKNGKEVIDTEGVREFLSKLYYPLYFLDFETFTQAIPEWDGLRPNQKIPFQYSLHYVEKDGGELFHKEFLAQEDSDPRENLAKRLVTDIPEGACVLVYNQWFEKSVIEELANQFSQYSDHLLDIHGNILDLMIPFQRKHYYTKEMKGRYSIKVVLPALMSDSSYSNIEINDGMEASNSYKNLPSINDKVEKDKIKEDLKIYCKQDTQSMVDLLVCLKKKVG